MIHRSIRRRTVLQALAGGVTGLSMPSIRRARAATPIRFVTSWYAQAEFGGFYEALAKGYYAAEGLDVRIEAASPQMNVPQLLLAGQADFITGYDFQILSAVASGIPLVAVASTFQHDQQGLMTHDDITALDQLRGHPILIASSSHVTFWPWLKEKYGFDDAQAARYTFNLQPFFANPAAAVQAYASSEVWDAQRNNVPVRFFPFAGLGYPPYGAPIVTTRQKSVGQQDTVRGFIRASLMGWRDYMNDPALGNDLILKANNRMTPDHLAFGIATLKKAGALISSDTATRGIGTMTTERWKATRDFMVAHKLLAETADWQSAFTTSYVDTLRIMPS